MKFGLVDAEPGQPKVCKTCVDEEKKYTRVECLGNSSTLVGWNAHYDDAGNYHSHNPNIMTTHYKCDNGHDWTEHVKYNCWCGWRG